MVQSSVGSHTTEVVSEEEVKAALHNSNVRPVRCDSDIVLLATDLSSEELFEFVQLSRQLYAICRSEFVE